MFACQEGIHWVNFIIAGIIGTSKNKRGLNVECRKDKYRGWNTKSNQGGSAIGISWRNNVFYVDYRRQREVKHLCPSHFALQETDNKQKVQMGFVDSHTKIVNLSKGRQGLQVWVCVCMCVCACYILSTKIFTPLAKCQHYCEVMTFYQLPIKRLEWELGSS